MKLKRKLTVPMVQLTCAVGLFSGALLVQHTAVADPSCGGSCSLKVSNTLTYYGNCATYTVPSTGTTDCQCNYTISGYNWFASTSGCGSKLET